MILGYYKDSERHMGQKMLAATELFGRQYYWMQDGDGTTYLVPVGEDGRPDFT
jgi:hypothetical protein